MLLLLHVLPTLVRSNYSRCSGSGVFDGSQNLNLTSSLALLSSLPHYDGSASATGTYTKVIVDAKGRITNASQPSSFADLGLNGTVEGQSAQAYDLDLVAVAGLTTTGFRTGEVQWQLELQGSSAGRIAVNNGGGVAGNPTIDIIATTVTAGNFNTEAVTSVSV